MEEILKLLKECKVFYFATTDGDAPAIRPFGFVMEHENQLCFSTNSQKEVYRQLQENPNAAICGCMSDRTWLRINGKMRAVTTEAHQKKALEIMPALSNMYSVGDDKFVIMAITEATATVYYPGQEPKIINI